MQRRVTAVGGVGVGAALEQEQRHRNMAPDGRKAERAQPFVSRVVDVGAGIQQETSRFDVADAGREHMSAVNPAAAAPDARMPGLRLGAFTAVRA